MNIESSGLKVQYELRPHKQVERRMLLDAFQRLAVVGFPISSYNYIGFGSFYFVDFIMFHKLLGITRMLSIEHSTRQESRVKFNQPYRFVDIHIGEAQEVIATLDESDKYLVWLDFDSVIHGDLLEDIRIAAHRLSPGSILLITVDSEPPGDDRDGPEQWAEYFESQAAQYLPAPLESTYFAASHLWRVNLQVLDRAVKAGVATRTNLNFQPFASFLYADGHEMLSIAGMIVGPDELSAFNRSTLSDTQYFRNSFEIEPFRIRVPNITRKERLYLDKAMPCPDGWTPSDFELDKEDIDAYRDIYRFFPPFAELLL